MSGLASQNLNNEMQINKPYGVELIISILTLCLVGLNWNLHRKIALIRTKLVSFSEKLINISQVWWLTKIFAHAKNAFSFYSTGNLGRYAMTPL